VPRYTKYPNKSKSKKVIWEKAPDINKRIDKIIDTLQIDWVDKKSIHAFKSFNSKTRAAARIWGLPRIWQMALNKKPSYIIEVITEKFDKLSHKKQDEILLHELAHIPKTFSGSLVPHFRKGKRKFNDRVRNLVKIYKEHNK